MVYFSSNSDYFEDFSKFSMQNIKRYSITLEKLVFIIKFWILHETVKIYQTGASYLLKKAILLKSVIFQWNTLNGMGFK